LIAAAAMTVATAATAAVVTTAVSASTAVAMTAAAAVTVAVAMTVASVKTAAAATTAVSAAIAAVARTAAAVNATPTRPRRRRAVARLPVAVAAPRQTRWCRGGEQQNGAMVVVTFNDTKQTVNSKKKSELQKPYQFYTHL
jgi:hypothetical protein